MDDHRLLPPSPPAYPLGLMPFSGEDAVLPSLTSSSFATSPATAVMPEPDPSLGAVNALLMQTAVPFSSKIYNVDRWRRETPPAPALTAAAAAAVSPAAAEAHYGIGLEGHTALFPLPPPPPPQGEIDGGREHERRRGPTGPPPFTPLTPAGARRPPPPSRCKCS